MVLLLCFGTPAGARATETPAAAGRSAEYTVTVIPYYAPEKIWTTFAPFIAHLRNTTGLPWELKLYPDHASLLSGLCKGEVSFAFLGPVPLARVIDRCDAGVAVVALGRDGQAYYRSVILTSDPTVRDLEGLKGKRFGLFKGSTAAHIIPLKMLHVAGVAGADTVPVFYDSQDHIMTALLQRQVAGAGVKETLYQKFKKEQLRVLKTSEPLPGFAFAVSPALRAKTRKVFVEALLKLDPLHDPGDRRLMQNWDDEIKNGFILPPRDYTSSVLNVLSVYREILHED